MSVVAATVSLGPKRSKASPGRDLSQRRGEEHRPHDQADLGAGEAEADAEVGRDHAATHAVHLGRDEQAPRNQHDPEQARAGCLRLQPWRAG
jgi:hypothetical protein